jgi:hypothetical protein
MWIAFLVYLVLTAAMFGWLIPWLGGAPPWRGPSSASSWYAYLKDWQTGIGALVGILGLVVVEAVNRWLERQRAAQERRKKQQAIAAALAWEVSECEERLRIAQNNIDDALGSLRGTKSAEISVTGKLAFALRLPAPVVLTNLALDLHLLDGGLRRAIMSFYNRLQSAERDVSRNIGLRVAERDNDCSSPEVSRAELEQVRLGIDRALEAAAPLRQRFGTLMSPEEYPWRDMPDRAPAPSGSIYACWWTGESYGCHDRHPER